MTDLKWSRFNFLVETEKHRKYLYNESPMRLSYWKLVVQSPLSLSQNNRMSVSPAFSEEEIEYLKKIYALVGNDDTGVIHSLHFSAFGPDAQLKKIDFRQLHNDVLCT